MRIILAFALAVAAWPASAGAQSPPLTLGAAVTEALAASPALSAPEDERTLASIRQRQADARFAVKFSPQFQTGTDPVGGPLRSIGGTVTKRLKSGASLQLQGDRLEFGEGANAFRDAGYTVGLSQPLFRGWTAVGSATIIDARRQKQAADASLADARQRLVLSVADAYFAVVRAERMAVISSSTLDNARRLRAASEARSRVGLATELDVLRADLLASQSEAALLTHHESRESALDALKTLVGRPVDSAFVLAEIDLEHTRMAPDVSVDMLVLAAQASRIDAQEARERIRDARRSESVARWNLLPPLSLDLSYTRRGLGPGTLRGYSDMLSGFRFGLGTTYSLDRSDETAAAAAAAVSVRAAEREAVNVERRVADDVRRAHRAGVRSSLSVELHRKAVGIAERQLRLAQIRYEQGVAGNFDMVDAQNNLAVAEAALVNAQIDRYLADLALRRAAGLLDPDSLQP